MKNNVPTSGLVSVVMPTYNRGRMIISAIGSVLNQTHSEFELIIVDDCSDAPLKPLVDRIGNPRVKYIRHEKNKGAGAARNTGVKAARGDFIAFLDDDDYWRSHAIESMLKAIDGYDVVICGHYEVYRGRARAHRNRSVRPNDLKKGNICGGMSVVLGRARAFKDTGFDEALPHAEDWDLFVRLVQRWRVGLTDQILVVYNDGNHPRITNVQAEMTLSQLKKRTYIYDKNKAFLGPFWYRYQKFLVYIAYIRYRKDWFTYFVFAIREFGLLPFLLYIYLRAKEVFEEKAFGR
jgi:glycosyltransferase involved in cell wall biosynthesis